MDSIIVRLANIFSYHCRENPVNLLNDLLSSKEKTTISHWTKAVNYIPVTQPMFTTMP